VEQNDFASGVTSRSTRIIHGGLRYLEHGELDLVRESVRERERLLRERSHLVQPVHFLLLMNENSQRSAMKVRAGLWLYQRMAGKKKSSTLSEMELKRVERALDSGKKWSIYDYEDAQCEFPERLVAEWLTEAMEAGAVVRNHSEVLASMSYTDAPRAFCCVIGLRIKMSGLMPAGWWNCTGPWADRVCQRSSVHTAKPMLVGFAALILSCRVFQDRRTHRFMPRPRMGGRCLWFRGTSRFWWARPKFQNQGIRARLRLRRKRLNICCALSAAIPQVAVDGE